MALQKTSQKFNFSQGLDLKTDPLQVPLGRFLSLVNGIFTKGGLLQKRNGFQRLPSLSNNPSFLTSFGGALAAVGTSLMILSADTGQWLNRGSIQPVKLSVVPAVRTTTAQTQVDVAVAPNGLACATYIASTPSYQIVDSSNGQIIVSQTALPSTATNPRVFVLGNYFVLTFTATVSASPHLQYVAIPLNNPSNPTAATDISTQVSSLSAGYDGASSGGNLFLSWNGSDVGGAIRSTFIDTTLTQHNTVTIASKTSDLMSVTVDTSGGNPVMWTSFWDTADHNGYSAAYTVTGQLTALLAATLTINNISGIQTITSSAVNGTLQLFYQTSNTYAFSSTRSDFVSRITCTSAGSVGSASVVLRSVGLASKAFYLAANQTAYFLVAYGGAFQPSYFLVDQSGNVIAKLAYENGGGYLASQVLPGVSLNGTTAQIGYLFKTQVVAVNKSQGVAAPAGIYGITGVNIASFTLNSPTAVTQEIGNNLHLTGGFLWMYDGSKPVEHQFHLFPEDIGVTTTASGGSISAQQYYYYALYAWTDAQGNIHKSAPSIPYGITVSSGSSTNTVKVPTLRLTYKTAPNGVRIELYRWSTGQQTPYLVTSISSPPLNDPTVDSVTFTDTAADSAILGNPILYTNGGIVEDLAAPATSISAIFKSRLWIVDAEDPNLLWFSKQVVDATPVEMSDLQTYFVPPTTSAQGTTGPITALAPMDDKLIIFKKNAIYYITGDGPSTTGANNDFSPNPIFIASVAGCTNQQSIVSTPNGLMFQSDKGIWLLGRDLSTTYIGAPVEAFNGATVQSAINIPGTNQVRFTMSSNVTLMFDYFFNQWGTFQGIPAIASTIYQNLHTYLNSLGQVLQENPGSFIDSASPVLMSFTTAWLQLAELQGYQRAYYFLLLGQYLTPHKLQVQIAYDYNSAIQQQALIAPNNFSAVFGADPVFGQTSPFGGASSVEQWKVNLLRQKCQAFQITVNEQYDPTFGVAAGAGLTLSGVNLVYGIKKGFAKVPASVTTG